MSVDSDASGTLHELIATQPCAFVGSVFVVRHRDVHDDTQRSTILHKAILYYHFFFTRDLNIIVKNGLGLVHRSLGPKG